MLQKLVAIYVTGTYYGYKSKVMQNVWIDVVNTSDVILRYVIRNQNKKKLLLIFFFQLCHGSQLHSTLWDFGLDNHSVYRLLEFLEHKPWAIYSTLCRPNNILCRLHNILCRLHISKLLEFLDHTPLAIYSTLCRPNNISCRLHNILCRLYNISKLLEFLDHTLVAVYITLCSPNNLFLYNTHFM